MDTQPASTKTNRAVKPQTSNDAKVDASTHDARLDTARANEREPIDAEDDLYANLAHTD